MAGCGLLAIGGLSASASAGAGAGIVAVRVVDSAGHGIPGAEVSLMLTEEDPYKDGTTDSSGLRTFTGVAPGRYELSAGGHGYLDSGVRLVTVHRGDTKRPRVRLFRPGRIAGTVTAADGSSPARLGVNPTQSVDPNFGSGDPSQVAPDGTYHVSNVPPGRYQVTWYDGSGHYLTQCPGGAVVDYGDRTCPAAEDVTVAEGETTTMPDQVLTHPAASFSGQVVDARGRPIRGAVTYPWQVGVGEVFGDVRYPHDDTTADRTGHYRVLGVPPGTYKLLVGSNESNDWADAAYGGGHSFKHGATFTLTAGEETRGIDVVEQRLVYLRSSPTVRGHRVTVPARVRWWGGEHPASGRVTISIGRRSATRTLHRTLHRGRVTAVLQGVPTGRQRITIHYLGTAYAKERTTHRAVTVR